MDKLWVAADDRNYGEHLSPGLLVYGRRIALYVSLIELKCLGGRRGNLDARGVLYGLCRRETGGAREVLSSHLISASRVFTLTDD